MTGAIVGVLLRTVNPIGDRAISWVSFLAACCGFCSGVMVAGMSDYRHKRHNVSSLLDHIVCPAKYRRVRSGGRSTLTTQCGILRL
jgi:hypothetical protein